MIMMVFLMKRDNDDDNDGIPDEEDTDEDGDGIDDADSDADADGDADDDADADTDDDEESAAGTLVAAPLLSLWWLPDSYNPNLKSNQYRLVSLVFWIRFILTRIRSILWNKEFDSDLKLKK